MNKHQKVDPTLLFPAAQDQQGMSLRQALAQFQTPRPANWTSDTGGTLGLVIAEKGVLFIEGVRNSDEFITWMTNNGATFVPFEEENSPPLHPPMQQDHLEDPRNWFGGDDPPPDDAFPTSSKRRGDNKR